MAASTQLRFPCWLLLAMFGLTSGILSMTLPPIPSPRLAGFFLIGAIFGLAIATGCVLCGRLRAFPEGALLAVVSTITYPAAFCACAFLTMPILAITGYRTADSEAPFAFVGGLLGGVVLCSLAPMLGGHRGRGQVFRRAAVGSVASGILSAVGWGLGPTLGKSLWAILPMSALPGSDALNSYSLFFVWHTSMAVIMGLMVDAKIADTATPAVRSGSLPGPSDDRSLGPGGRTLAVAAVALAVLVATRAVPIRLALADRNAAVAKKIAERPTDVNLPLGDRMATDQALIMEDVAGFRPGHANEGTTFVSYERGFQSPGSYIYSVTYLALGSGISRVEVRVQQYPSAEWAKYFATYPPNMYNSFDDPNRHAIVTKFGNRVRTNALVISPAGEHLYYMWASGNDVVTLEFGASTGDEQFLQRYLEKYPSSL
jgi:hypothetical protein